MGPADPTAIDLLQNRELVQLAIGIHQVIFAFDQNVTLSVEGHFNYASASGSVDWCPGKVDAAAKAVTLIRRRGYCSHSRWKRKGVVGGVPLHTVEEGRSDLTLLLRLIERDDGKIDAEIDGIHVLSNAA